MIEHEVVAIKQIIYKDDSYYVGEITYEDSLDYVIAEYQINKIVDLYHLSIRVYDLDLIEDYYSTSLEELDEAVSNFIEHYKGE